MPAVFTVLVRRLPTNRISKLGACQAPSLWPCLLSLLPLLAWDFSGVDLPLARLLATSRGFPWQHHWLPARLLYVVPRAVDAALLLMLVAAVALPWLTRGLLTRREAVWWLITTATCLLLIIFMKKISATSCPWSLAEFGGEPSTTYVSHWAFGRHDGGPGGCFPSGHASTAFAFLPGCYALKRASPKAARLWLTGVVVAGLAVGASQTVRGAHYVSHSLWTAWICWAVSSFAFMAWRPCQGRAYPTSTSSTLSIASTSKSVSTHAGEMKA